jgi:hypothetical protein
MYYTIYKVTNKINSIYYIGKHQTKDLNDGYMGSGKILKKAIKKYGIENFTKEILYIFDTEEEMNSKEKELVIISEDTYNLCEGGKGGFSYINKNKMNHKQAFKKNDQKTIDISKKGSEKLKILFQNENWKNKRSEKIKESKKLSNYKHVSKKGYRLSIETRLKQSQSAKGEKNSQYGTCWVTNGQENKKINKKELDNWISLGYYKGRI